ncbi:hypothetical protein 010DV004_284 [Bacillus phage 010DV004]|nr:hypothetical protein 010DV004_19 [Bacillus phage 010DV004]QZA69216.1 hypothetical protein 010DV004_284 [Bacillus phage 010DV004]QZA69237.1 hypothetical protein 010DV005_19 [Bacillus phage 010DV005]QZA69497.1 hypothetical protein 010DV005_285 [Bacillus phage 010DV005]
MNIIHEASTLSIEEKGQLIEQMAIEIFEEIQGNDEVAENIKGLANVFRSQIMSKVEILASYAGDAYKEVNKDEGL